MTLWQKGSTSASVVPPGVAGVAILIVILMTLRQQALARGEALGDAVPWRRIGESRSRRADLPVQT